MFPWSRRIASTTPIFSSGDTVAGRFPPFIPNFATPFLFFLYCFCHSPTMDALFQQCHANIEMGRVGCGNDSAIQGRTDLGICQKIWYGIVEWTPVFFREFLEREEGSGCESWDGVGCWIHNSSDFDLGGISGEMWEVPVLRFTNQQRFRHQFHEKNDSLGS